MPSGRKRETLPYLTTFTIVVFGDSSVGKTSLCKVFLGWPFSDHYLPTRPEDFYSTQIVHKERNYKVDIIDTCGPDTDSFPAMRRVEINKAHAIMFVYSLDKLHSFGWLEQIKEEIVQQRGNNLPVMVVANKADVVLNANTLSISTKEITKKQWGFLWRMTSAKMAMASDVQKLFHDLIDEAQKRNLQSVKVEPAKSEKKWCKFTHNNRSCKNTCKPKHSPEDKGVIMPKTLKLSSIAHEGGKEVFAPCPVKLCRSQSARVGSVQPVKPCGTLTQDFTRLKIKCEQEHSPEDKGVIIQRRQSSPLLRIT